MPSFRKMIAFLGVGALLSCDKAAPLELIVGEGVPPATDTPVLLTAENGRFGTEMAITSGNILYTERYTTSDERVVDARKLNGDTLWSVNLGCTQPSCPIAADSAGNVVAVGANKLVELNAANGKQKWQYPFAAQAIAIGSSRIFGSRASNLATPATAFMLDASDGAPLWQTIVPNENVIRVLVDATRGNMYVLSQGGATALSISTGAVKWTTALSRCFNFSEGALAADGTLYVSCVNDMSAALDAYTPEGILKWSVALSSSPPVQQPLIDAAGNIYAADEANVTSLSPGGSVRWQATGFRRNLSAPVIDKAGNVFILAASSLTDNTHLYIVRDGTIAGDKGPFSTQNPGTFALTSTGAVYYTGGSLIYFQSAGFDGLAQWPQPGRNSQRMSSR